MPVSYGWSATACQEPTSTIVVHFHGKIAPKRVSSRTLAAGDVMLIRGGHGFEVIEDLEMIEVKQGPYAGDLDKVRLKKIVNNTVPA
jgi:hypothetical protein